MQTFPSTWALFDSAWRVAPEREAVVEGALRLDYAGLAARVAQRLEVLRAAGVDPGDRVALLEHNHASFLEWTFAAAGCGAVLVPLNTRWSPAEIAFVLEDAEVWVLLRGEDFEETTRAVLPRLAAGSLTVMETSATGSGDSAEALGHPVAPPDRDEVPGSLCRPDDPAFLYYTSGTTGRPKGVVLTHANVCVHAAWCVEELGLSQQDRWAHVAPMFHLADAWATLAITQARGVHVHVPRFDEGAVLAAFAAERVTLTNLVPTMLNRLVYDERAGGLPHLRRILSGGAPIAPSLVERIVTTFGCGYVQTYGMTETSPFLTVSLLSDAQRGLPAEEAMRLRARTGRPFGGIDLRIVDEGGRLVPKDDRTVGEIQVRGATVTPGYWRRPEATAEAFDEGGWLRTGDLAVIDAHGFVNIVDRKKDMIVTGGENVYSTEVEHVLMQHDAVREAAVFGRPDADWGERVCAAVVLVRGAAEGDAELLRAHCRRHLAGYKTPREVSFLDELPKTGSGKIAKRLLREP